MKTKTLIVVAIIITIVFLVVFGKDYNSSTTKAEDTISDTIVEADPHLGHHAMESDAEAKPFYQGEIVNFEHGGGYTYIEVKEKTEKTFWIAVEKADVKKGDFIQFQKELVMHNFKSKALNKTFDEIMFASNLFYKVKE